jgi:hypothetical protein
MNPESPHNPTQAHDRVAGYCQAESLDRAELREMTGKGWDKSISRLRSPPWSCVGSCGRGRKAAAVADVVSIRDEWSKVSRAGKMRSTNAVREVSR